MLQIDPVSAFSDNYIWLLHQRGEAWVVDPGDAAPVEKALAEKNLQLRGILVTHHHFDHTGGIANLVKSNPGIDVIGPESEHYQQTSRTVLEGDTVEVLGQTFSVLTIPGHTLDHIAYFATPHQGPPLLLCGDTLFAGGCGRVFEGTPAMMHQSLSKLATLPADTAFYCAHEYTLANLDFALAVEPNNLALQKRVKRDSERRQQNIPTVPATVGEELATNPFLRSQQPAVIAAAAQQNPGSETSEVQVFATIREWKNNF